MGWWKVDDTGSVIGDDVCLVLTDAVAHVVRLYKGAFGRLPSRSEWEILLHDALQPSEDVDTELHFPMLESVGVERVRIDLSSDGTADNEPR